MFRLGRSSYLQGFGGGGRGGNFTFALILVAMAFFSYFSSSEHNELTGETQRVALSADQEIALGLNAAPQMMSQYGGEDRNARDVARVKAIGARLVERSAVARTNWQFEFHLLADNQTINAFALPGGQVFITRALYEQLDTDGQLAGVLGHEIGHVVARHGAEHMAKEKLTQGLAQAAVVASGDHGAGQMAAMVGKMVNMKYGREDEIESDVLGVRFMSEAGYDPRGLLHVMAVLKKAAGGKRQAEFFSTHPNPDNREQRILAAIEQAFPQGLPSGLEK